MTYTPYTPVLNPRQRPPKTVAGMLDKIAGDRDITSKGGQLAGLFRHGGVVEYVNAIDYHGGGTNRTGQVWALGPHARTVWVIDDETGEAVLVAPSKRTGYLHFVHREGS